MVGPLVTLEQHQRANDDVHLGVRGRAGSGPGRLRAGQAQGRAGSGPGARKGAISGAVAALARAMASAAGMSWAT